MVVLVGLIEEDRLGACGEVVPAICFEYGAVHGDVQLAQPLDILGGLDRIVEAIVSLGHTLVAGDHERGAVVVVRAAVGLELFRRSNGWKWESSETARGIIDRGFPHR